MAVEEVIDEGADVLFGFLGDPPLLLGFQEIAFDAGEVFALSLAQIANLDVYDIAEVLH